MWSNMPTHMQVYAIIPLNASEAIAKSTDTATRGYSS